VLKDLNAQELTYTMEYRKDEMSPLECLQEPESPPSWKPKNSGAASSYGSGAPGPGLTALSARQGFRTGGIVARATSYAVRGALAQSVRS
jgi:hypothetical protein